MCIIHIPSSDVHGRVAFINDVTRDDNAKNYHLWYNVTRTSLYVISYSIYYTYVYMSATLAWYMATRDLSTIQALLMEAKEREAGLDGVDFCLYRFGRA
jgi:hypothetical protein